MNSSFQQAAPWDGFLPAASHALSSVDRAAIARKRILITGASGYIGSALARVIETLSPERLVLLDTAYIEPSPNIIFERGSVCENDFVNAIFSEHNPHIVFHAAALKHVPLMENDPFGAIAVNTLGTQVVVDAATRFHAEQFILVSTDKAVDPISIMGAGKRLAELITLGEQSPVKMKVLRLCNVLGSSGSVAPLFKNQIIHQHQVTVTDACATRYFISLDHTIKALLSTAAPTLESGLFIPEVGSAHSIEDLARYLILTMSSATSIVHTGLRIGDKLHEKMTSDRESLLFPTPDNMLVRIQSTSARKQVLEEHLVQIRASIADNDLAHLLRSISKLVPEYSPSETILSLASTARP